MGGPKKLVGIFAVGAVSIGLLVPPAAGQTGDPPRPRNTIIRQDGNDTRGPLDLRSLRVSHIGRWTDRIQFATFGRVRNTQIDGDRGEFEIGIDLKGDTGYEYILHVRSGGGRIRGVLYRTSTNRVVDGSVPAARINGKAFRVDIELRTLRRPTSYAFGLFGIFRGSPCSDAHPCIDGIPDRFPLILHDRTKPSFRWISVPRVSTDRTADLQSPVTFGVKDDRFGSGIRRWTVQRRQLGQIVWQDVQSGNGLRPTVNVPGVQGATFQVRVLVVDKQNNQRVSTLQRTTFPYDDGNPIFNFDMGWTPAMRPQAFLQTAQVGALNATVTITIEGAHPYCFLGGPVAMGPGTATLKVNNGAPMPMPNESALTAPRQQLQCGTTGIGTNTLEVVVTSANGYVLDGLVVRPP